MAKSQKTPKPESYAALEGWWMIIHMWEFMHEFFISSWNLGFPHISNVDRTFVMIARYMVTSVKFGNTDSVTQSP